MQVFSIRLRSVQDVQDFVGLATTMSFPVLVKDGHHRVSASSFMEMFCLDCTRPLSVCADCTEEQMEAFRTAAHRFLAK